jgi:pimeloyl-ACP methyl ester carboxylesterase
MLAAGVLAAAICTPQFAQAASGKLTLSNGATVTYYYNVPLTTKSTTVTSAVISIHGTDRDASNYDKWMATAAQKAGVTGSTIIVTPLFAASGSGSALYWSDSGWKYGGNSNSSKVMSSYAVIDEIVKKLSDVNTFPKLTKITIVGHSAGGQFVQRYAAANAVDGSTRVPVRYVAANPSSYMYLNGYRASASGQWTIPTGCADYNEYRYGVDDLRKYPYVAAVGASGLVSRYPGRKVTYLLGTADTASDSDMDTTCEGMLQGASRYQRGVTFSSFMKKYYATNKHAQALVSGVAHNPYDMYTSSVGRQAIFF